MMPKPRSRSARRHRLVAVRPPWQSPRALGRRRRCRARRGRRCRRSVWGALVAWRRSFLVAARGHGARRQRLGRPLVRDPRAPLRACARSTSRRPRTSPPMRSWRAPRCRSGSTCSPSTATRSRAPSHKSRGWRAPTCAASCRRRWCSTSSSARRPAPSRFGALYLADADGNVFKRATPDEAAGAAGGDRHRPRRLPRRSPSAHARQLRAGAARDRRLARVNGARPPLGEVHVDRIAGVTALYRARRRRAPRRRRRLARRRASAATTPCAARSTKSNEVPRLVYVDNRARPDRVTVKLASAPQPAHSGSKETERGPWRSEKSSSSGWTSAPPRSPASWAR